jgi:hypothetical protein
MHKQTYNSNHIRQKDGSIKASFAAGWINYVEANGQWKPINTHFVDAGERFEVSQAPFIMRAPKLSTDTAEFISNNRYDIFTDSIIIEDDFSMLIKAIDIAEVRGEIEIGNLGFGQTNYVIYRNAYPNLDADLIYYVQHGCVPCLRKLVRFNSKPESDIALKFELSFQENTCIKDHGEIWDKKSTLSSKGAVSFRREEGNSMRGIGLYDLYLWDKWDNRQKIDAELSPLDNNKILLTKHIPLTYFDNVSFPCYTDASASFNPDANPETSSVDGYMTREVDNQSWTSIRSGAGTAANDSSTTLYMIIEAGKNNDEFGLMRRIKLVFDTSSIGAGYYIDSADLKYTPSIILSNAFSSSIAITSATTVSDTSLSASDYNIASFGSTRLASDVLVSSMTAGVEVSAALNAAGISNIDLEGKSRFALRLDHDVDDVQPAWSSNASTDLRFYSSDNGADEPQLDITYFEETNNINLPLLGVG